ncbi:MAG: MFS transporter [Sphingobium phenoxybenzoativorans]
MTAEAILQSAHAPLSSRRRLKAIIGGAAGNFVEWFDWFIFVSFAIYYAPIFFPKGDLTVQLLQSAAVLALGFVVRPLGAWLFGLYADRRGRRAALSLSVGLMCTGSCLIALTPGHAVIGAFAPVILLTARLLQGLSVGGEYGASATYISEMAGSGRRGFWSSFQCVTLVLGQLSALCLLMLLQSLLSPEALASWGWRLAFLLGAALAVVVFWIRRGLDESHSFRAAEPDKVQNRAARHLLTEHRKATILVFALTAAGSTGFYVFIGYMQKFLVNTSGFTAPQATAIMAVALVIFLLAQPLFGLLSDIIGRRRSLIMSFGATALCTVPVMQALSTARHPAEAFALILVPLLLFSGYTAIGAVVKAELYPAHIRALGVGLPYALANAVFGGTGEFLALWFKRIGREDMFFYYLAAVMLAGLIVALLLPETRDHGLIED